MKYIFNYNINLNSQLGFFLCMCMSTLAKKIAYEMFIYLFIIIYIRNKLEQEGLICLIYSSPN
jgi:hypothetical protein